MREYPNMCKARRQDNNEWISGFYSIGFKDKFKRHYITEIKEGFTVQHEIDIDTLCRSTGLKDKNDNEIFENDLVFSKFNSIIRARVIWNDEVASFKLYYGRDIPFGSLDRKFNELVVIGSYLDNLDSKSIFNLINS